MSITAAAKILNKVYKVFAFDFRGHGLNRDIENRYHLDVDSLIDDGRQVIEFIRQNYGHNHKIVFMGHSMGGAIASKLAMQEQQNHQPVSAVLLIDIVEAAIESFDNNDRYIQNIPSSFLSYEDAIV